MESCISNSLRSRTLRSLTRKRKTVDPCLTCFLHRERCICAAIPRLSLATRLILVIHSKELKRTTNTGRLAIHALENSKMIVRGDKSSGNGEEAKDLSYVLDQKYQTFLLYPSSDAMELNEALVGRTEKPIQLIVPDGNWRQAGKVHTRHSELQQVPRVKLRKNSGPSLNLRAESSENGMATLHAIALAMAEIEGEQAGDALMHLYEMKLSKTLEGRGIKF